MRSRVMKCYSGFHVMRFILLSVAIALQTCPVSAASPSPRVRVSCWYWLNSTPKSHWAADFKAMKQLGLTDVVMVWGLDATAFSTRLTDSHQAIADADRAGLGSYLFVWHARHNAMHHEPRYQQVDAGGHVLYAFDTFNPRWRQGQWRDYLQSLAREYGKQKGLAGYIFDNCFAIGNIGAIDGEAPKPKDSYLAYGRFEQAQFGRHLPLGTDDPSWPAWTRMREQWWADWAEDTQKAIRSIDIDPGHKIILEDGDNTIDPDAQTRAGFKLRSVATHFDVMSAYLAPRYSSGSQDKELGVVTSTYLNKMRAAIPDGKELALSLRLSDGDTEDLPGHADKPTLDQITKCIDAALKLGVRNIDLYGYRMGVYHLDGPGWHKFQPGHGLTYPLTGEIKGKFLADRPELWVGLAEYLQRIQTE